MAPLKVVGPVPASVSVKPEAVAAPMLTVPKVSVLPPVMLLVKVALAVSVRAPLNVMLCAPDTVLAAVRETAFETPCEASSDCSVPPLKLNVPLARPPLLELLSCSVPPMIVVAPAELFVPVMVSVPALTVVTPL